MAQKKGGGSTRNGRDSKPKMLGVKKFGGELVSAGAIIVRQCGTRWKPGYLVHRGKDDTLMALSAGTVRFRGTHVDIIPADPSVPAYDVVGSSR